CICRRFSRESYSADSGRRTAMTFVAKSPNHALHRTPGFAVQFPIAAVALPAPLPTVLPAMKPGTARAFALRRRAHSRAPGPESLSLGSLGVLAQLPRERSHEDSQHERYVIPIPSYPMPRLFPVCSELFAGSPSHASRHER